MKRIILSVSLYIIISSILSLREPLKETYIKSLSVKSAEEIVNNLIKPSFPISDEKKN
jgi:hypothetical protein